MPRRIVKAVRRVKKFYGLGRYNVVKKGRGLRSTRAATAESWKKKETMSEFKARVDRGVAREVRHTMKRGRKAGQLQKAHQTRRRATAGSGLVIVGAGGVTYGVRRKRKRQS